MTTESSKELESKNSSFIELEIGPRASWKLDTYGNGKYRVATIDWAAQSLKTKNKILAQNFLLNRWSNHKKTQGNIIARREFNLASSLLKILLIFEQHYQYGSLQELDRNELAKLLNISVFMSLKQSSHETKLVATSKPLSKGTLDRAIVISKAMYKSFRATAITDGPNIDIRRSDVYALLKLELKSRGFSFTEWDKGGSHGSIPFAISHLLLADAINTINAPETKLMLSYFKFMHDCQDKIFRYKFWKLNATSCPIKKYRLTGSIYHVHSYLERNISSTSKPLEQTINLNNYLNQNSLGADKFKFPWPGYTEFREAYNNIIAAAYIIFLSVMGKRGPSEILTLRVCDITPPDVSTDKDALMRISDLKTGHGLRIEQGVTNEIDLTFKTLVRLSYVNKIDSDLPLFTSLPTLTKNTSILTPIGSESSNKILKSYYQNFCIRHLATLDFNIEDHHSNLTSHQFRHSWSEFSLRRFDGNVEEKVRQHFLHSFNHWFTKPYTRDKLDEEISASANRNYLKELIPRVLLDSDIDPDFVGAVALYIKKSYSGNAQVMSPIELEKFTENLAADFLNITPHEYGWCCPHKTTISAAKCKDELGQPQPSTTDSSKCNSCSNFLSSRQSHYIKQLNIAILHHDFLEQNIWKMSSLRKQSKKAVEHAITLFPELSDLV